MLPVLHSPIKLSEDFSRCSRLAGGGGGIGFAIIRTLMDMGAHVAILDLLPPTEALQKLPAEFDRKLKYIQYVLKGSLRSESSS